MGVSTWVHKDEKICQKMKYLVDRYKDAKHWNKAHTGDVSVSLSSTMSCIRCSVVATVTMKHAKHADAADKMPREGDMKVTGATINCLKYV